MPPRRARRSPSNAAIEVRFEIVLSGQDIERWTEAAQREGLTLPEIASVGLSSRGAARARPATLPV